MDRSRVLLAGLALAVLAVVSACVSAGLALGAWVGFAVLAVGLLAVGAAMVRWGLGG